MHHSGYLVGLTIFVLRELLFAFYPFCILNRVSETVRTSPEGGNFQDSHSLIPQCPVSKMYDAFNNRVIKYTFYNINLININIYI